jgi:hypothetical protein
MTSPRTRPTVLEVFGAFALTFAAVTTGLAADDDPLLFAPPKSSLSSLAPILKKIAPAVVHIETRGRMAPDPKSRRRDSRDVHSVGSGVVYDAQRGFIVTNNHVLEYANEITVTLTDGRILKARRVGGDPDFDLAVISVPAERLTAMPFGDSRQLEVGDFVFAIGYPANIGQSVTSGTVSGLHRSNIGIEEFENFIQTDDERTARIHRIDRGIGCRRVGPNPPLVTHMRQVIESPRRRRCHHLGNVKSGTRHQSRYKLVFFCIKGCTIVGRRRFRAALCTRSARLSQASANFKSLPLSEIDDAR